jgi:MFS family permease
MNHLIAARVIQGFGAGIITPVTLAMITDMFPPEKRGSMIGIFGLVQLLANLLSPPLGSFITKNIGWAWIFFLNLGLIGLSSFMILLDGRNKERLSTMQPFEIDIAGGLIFGGFCVLSVGFTNILSRWSEWNLNMLWFLIAIVISAVMLAVVESRHRNPVIKMEFLKTKIIRSSIISSILAGAIMYGLVTILPLCGIILSKQGFRFDESKILLLFIGGITIGLLASSWLVVKLKSDHYPKFLWGLMSVSAVLMIYSIDIQNLLLFNVVNVMIGLGTGGVMATFLINSQNAIHSEDRTTLSGLIQLGRYFGASLGVTLLAGMLPDVTFISGIGQFLGAFGLLVALCTAGLVNEII